MKNAEEKPNHEKQLKEVRAERQAIAQWQARLEENREFCEAALRRAHDWNERFQESAPIATATEAIQLQDKLEEGSKKAVAQYDEATGGIRRRMARVDAREDEILQSRDKARRQKQEGK